VHLLNHPDLIEQVLVTDSRNFIKSVLRRGTSEVFGRGLLASDGELWLRQRRLMQPAFHRARIAAYAETMTAFAERAVADWKDGDVHEVHTAMMQLTLEIVVMTLFGTSISRDGMHHISHALDLALQRSAELLSVRRYLRYLPRPSDKRFQQAMQQLNRTIHGIITSRRESGVEGDDLLAMLLEAVDEDGGMSDQQVRDEAVTLVLTGHETVATSLTWTWYLLSQHPEVEMNLTQELDEVLSGRTPTFDDLPRLRYATNIIKESMRLYPPGWIIAREAVQDCRIGGYDVPGGTQLVMCQWTMHRDARWFADPLAFNPDRWTPEFEAGLPKFAYFPFGGGARRCIGDSFAMMEATLVLATIAQRLRLRLVPGHPVALLPQLTLRPRYGMRMKAERK
jgi:cytochrome P450